MSHKVITEEQLAAALELVILQGLTVVDVATKFRVSEKALYSRLLRSQQYQEYRDRQKVKEAKDREKVLVLGRSGFSARVIARELNISVSTARGWLLKAGIDTVERGKRRPLLSCMRWANEEAGFVLLVVR